MMFIVSWMFSNDFKYELCVSLVLLVGNPLTFFLILGPADSPDWEGWLMFAWVVFIWLNWAMYFISLFIITYLNSYPCGTRTLLKFCATIYSVGQYITGVSNLVQELDNWGKGERLDKVWLSSANLRSGRAQLSHISQLDRVSNHSKVYWCVNVYGRGLRFI